MCNSYTFSYPLFVEFTLIYSIICSSSDGLRPQQLDCETRMIGRSLLKTDDEQGDEDDENGFDDDYDFADIECANVTFTPILR